MTGPVHGSRFENGVQKYADYLESVEGRLRLDLAFTNLQEFLPEAKQSLLILDVGCGTSALAARLARLGHNVTKARQAGCEGTCATPYIQNEQRLDRKSTRLKSSDVEI